MKIKNLLSNKKTLLSLIAGVTITVGAIAAGTYAWFTGADEVEVSGSFNTATVGVEAGSMELNAYDFYPGDYPWHQTVEKQRVIESNFDNWWNEDKREVRYGYFWEAMPPSFGGTNNQYPEVNIFEIDQVPSADILANKDEPTGNNRVNLIKNAFNVSDSGHIYNVTPGSIIEALYNFGIKNDSYIPVYFRISNSTLSGEEGTELAYIQSAYALITGDGDVSMRVPLSLVGDYYYCPMPLSPQYGWDATISIYGYISGAKNGNDMQSITFSFSTEDDNPIIEVIQATNNAVFLADGWKDAAMSVSSDSVVSPEAPEQSGEFFIPYVDAEMYTEYLKVWGFN